MLYRHIVVYCIKYVRQISKQSTTCDILGLHSLNENRTYIDAYAFAYICVCVILTTLLHENAMITVKPRRPLGYI